MPFAGYSADPKSCRIALKSRAHSPWIRRLLEEMEFEVVLADANGALLIVESRKKDERLNAQTMERAAHVDPQLLAPVRDRSSETQTDLSLIRARTSLVHSRKFLINSARDGDKITGEWLHRCDTSGITPA